MLELAFFILLALFMALLVDNAHKSDKIRELERENTRLQQTQRRTLPIVTGTMGTAYSTSYYNPQQFGE